MTAEVQKRPSRFLDPVVSQSVTKERATWDAPCGFREGSRLPYRPDCRAPVTVTIATVWERRCPVHHRPIHSTAYAVACEEHADEVAALEAGSRP